MNIDLHIHSREGSDGRLGLEEIFNEAHKRGIRLISITDHDSIECQEKALALARAHGMHYLTGVELSISFSHESYRDGKKISLDMLGYGFDYTNEAMLSKLIQLKMHRRKRAELILDKINVELKKEGRGLFTEKDLEAIEETVDGAFGRPHIADYMVKKGIVSGRQEAFDTYLVRCNVPKMPLSLEEAASLVRGAGGRIVFAHPANRRGTSLIKLTKSIEEQHAIIRQKMLEHLDGIECWHSGHDNATTTSYLRFAQKEGLMVTGGSDCHQQPVIMGTIRVPDYVAGQFGIDLGKAPDASVPG